MSKESSFTLVKHRKKQRNSKQFVSAASNIHDTVEETHLDEQKIYGRILQCKEEILLSPFYNRFTKVISEVIKETGCSQINNVVCFGLGHIGHCSISQYQLGLLLNICSQYNVPETLIHDPIFNSIECKILKNLGLSVMIENEEAKYKIGSKELTLIYMPHCPKQLVNNLLWKNWGTQLCKCVVIGNSFTQIIETNSDRFLKEQAIYITKIFPHIVEYKLENIFKFTDIFNDTSIHLFLEQKLNILQSEFWESSSEPVYSKDDTEYITSMLKSKLELN